MLIFFILGLDTYLQVCHYHYATTTTINFTLTLQYLSFDFYTAAVFFSRTQKSKGDI